MNTRPIHLSWWRKLCYKWSMHAEVEKALRWMYATGYTAGFRDAQKSVPWPMTFEETGPHTDPTLKPIEKATPAASLQSLPPGTWTRAVLHAPGNSLHSQVLNALHPPDRKERRERDNG